MKANALANETQEGVNHQHADDGHSSKQVGGKSVFKFLDNSPRAISSARMQLMANNTPRVGRVAQLQALADGYSSQRWPEKAGEGVVQAQFTPQSRKHLGHEDPADHWLDETIGNVVMHRLDNMHYTKTDGDNTGSIKHYVPYNWIMKNIADKHVIGYQRHTVVARLATILEHLGLDLPGSYPENPADFDALISNSVYMICDWEENLFKSGSTGDHGGTQLDIPHDPAVLTRVNAAKGALGDLADPPLS